MGRFLIFSLLATYAIGSAISTLRASDTCKQAGDPTELCIFRAVAASEARL